MATFDELWGSDAQSVSAPTATSTSFDALWDGGPPQEEPGTVVSLASGGLANIAGLGDLADLTSRGLSYISPTNLASRALTGKSAYELATGEAEPQTAIGDTMRKGFDLATGVKDSTQLGKGSLAYKIGEYAPLTMTGLVKSGIKATAKAGGKELAKNIAKLSGVTALTGTGGYVGEQAGGVPGEIVGAVGAGALPTAASKVLKATTSALPKMADAFERSAIGATKADFKKSLKLKGIQSSPDGETSSSLKNAIQEVSKDGAFKGSKSPTALLDKNTAKLNQLEDDLDTIIVEADKANPTVTVPSYPIAQKFVSSSKTERTNLKKAYDEITAELNQTLDGSLASIQQAKRELYGKVYGENAAAKETVAKYIAADLKKTIENTVDSLARRKLINSKSAGQVKELNRKSGQYQQVRPILQREVGAAEGEAPLSWMRNAIKTTGGVLTSPTLIGSALGGSVGGPMGLLAGALLGGATSKTGRFAIAAGSRKGIPLASKGAKGAKAISKDALLSAILNSGSKGLLKLGGQDASSDYQSDDISTKKKSSVASPTPSAKPTPIFMAKPSVPESLVKAVVAQESGGKVNAVSEVGAQGLMQLMPATGKELAARVGVKYDPFDAEQNKQLGSLYLSDLLKKYDGDVELALTAYHTGMGNVDRYLKEEGGTTLADIKHRLGPVGKKYAEGVLKRIKDKSILV